MRYVYKLIKELLFEMFCSHCGNCRNQHICNFHNGPCWDLGPSYWERKVDE